MKNFGFYIETYPASGIPTGRVEYSEELDQLEFDPMGNWVLVEAIETNDPKNHLGFIHEKYIGVDKEGWTYWL